MRLRRMKQGSLLLVTIAMVLALIFFTTAFLANFNASQNRGLAAEQEEEADAAAQAGIDVTVAQLKAQFQAGQTASPFVPSPAASTLAQGTTYTIVVATPTTNPVVPYSTDNRLSSVANTKGWMPGMKLTDFATSTALRTVPPGMLHLVVIGKSGNVSRVHEALIAQNGSPFRFGVFAVQQINLNNNLTKDPLPTPSGQISGNVGSNATTTPLAIPAPGNTANINGSLTVSVNFTPPPVVMPTGLSTVTTTSSPLAPGFYNTPLSSTTEVDVVGGTLGHPTVYVFNQGVSLTANNANFVLKPNAQGQFGPTQVFIVGDASFNTIVNNSSDPFNMTIFQVPPSPSATKGGSKGTPAPTPDPSASFVTAAQSNSNFGLYAPTSNVTLNGGSTIFGAVVVQNLTMGGNTYLVEDHNLQSFTFSSVNLGPGVVSRW